MWLFFALAAAVIWGVNYAASGRVISRGLSPATLFLIDSAFAMVAMGALLVFSGKADHIVTEVKGLGKDGLWLAVAMLCSTAAGLFIFMAIEGKNATVASLIEISYPLFVALFAWVFFREAQLNTQTVIGGALIIAGVFVVWRGNY